MRLLLKIYKLTLSPILKFMFGGGGCRFYPQELSCSEYTVEVIEKYGIMKGGVLAVKRIASCNSFNKN